MFGYGFKTNTTERVRQLLRRVGARVEAQGSFFDELLRSVEPTSHHSLNVTAVCFCPRIIPVRAVVFLGVKKQYLPPLADVVARVELSNKNIEYGKHLSLNA